MRRYPGKVVWFELFTPDAEKSRAFWAEVAGWSASEAPMADGTTYTLLSAKDQPVAGLMSLGLLPPGVPSHFFAYVSTEDVDATAAACASHGGQVVMPAFDVPGVGRIAVVTDTEGATFGVFCSAMDDAEDAPSSHGQLHWAELWAEQPERARAYYAQVFGYEHATFPIPQGGEYTVLKHGDAPRAGLLQSPMPALPAQWVLFIHVDDVDRALRTAEDMGGERLHGPENAPGVGRFCMLRDNVGAIIGLITPEASA